MCARRASVVSLNDDNQWFRDRHGAVATLTSNRRARAAFVCDTSRARGRVCWSPIGTGGIGHSAQDIIYFAAAASVERMKSFKGALYSFFPPFRSSPIYYIDTAAGVTFLPPPPAPPIATPKPNIITPNLPLLPYNRLWSSSSRLPCSFRGYCLSHIQLFFSGVSPHCRRAESPNGDKPLHYHRSLALFYMYIGFFFLFYLVCVYGVHAFDEHSRRRRISEIAWACESFNYWPWHWGQSSFPSFIVTTTFLARLYIYYTIYISTPHFTTPDCAHHSHESCSLSLYNNYLIMHSLASLGPLFSLCRIYTHAHLRGHNFVANYIKIPRI